MKIVTCCFASMAVGVLVLSTLAQAQDPPKFEIATVKATDPKGSHEWGPKTFPGGRLTVTATPLKGLICFAFNLPRWQTSGGDAWIDKDEYDIEGRPTEESRAKIKNLRSSWAYGIEDEHLRELLQGLLIERFGLKFHREARESKAYLLERSGKPITLHSRELPGVGAPQDAGFSGSIGFAGGQWSIHNATMPQLAKFAADFIFHFPVIDQTELRGAFDYRQRVPEAEADANYSDNTDSFLRLIPELGLKLERTTATVQMFVIDRVEKPSAN